MKSNLEDMDLSYNNLGDLSVKYIS